MLCGVQAWLERRKTSTPCKAKMLHRVQAKKKREEMNYLKRLIQELYEERQKIEKLLRITNQELKNKQVPGEKVIVKTRGNSFQFYLREADEAMKYLPIKEKEWVADIVKMEYYNKLKKKLEERLNVIDRCIRGLGRTEPSQVFEILGRGKQRMIEPIEPTDEQFRSEWEACEYCGKEFWNGDAEIYTDKGERVRSKSEKIIADKLYKENIAYRYEYPLKLLNGTIVFPDFTILDEIRRRNIIFEHFGMMDNEEYANNAISKLQMYAREGYVLGDNLFVTMETSERPLDSRVLDGIVGLIKGEWL